MYRFNVDNSEEAARLLDISGIPYDFDGYGRIMVEGSDASEAVALWDKDGIDYDEI